MGNYSGFRAPKKTWKLNAIRASGVDPGFGGNNVKAIGKI